MKSCPTCHRTYPDDTLAFCLIDGSLLSAPFDGQTGPSYPSRNEPPPTEILHQRPSRAETIPAPRPQPTMPTYPSSQPPSQSVPKSSSGKWIALGVAAFAVLAIAGVGILLLSRSLLSESNANQNRPPSLSTTSAKNSSWNEATPAPSPSPEKLDVSGRWVGTNDEDKATLIINRSDTDSYLGTELISGSAQIKLAVEIKVDPVTRHITINETEILQGAGRWNLGFNQGTISADGQKMSGTAKDVKEKIYSWSFTKQ